MLFFLVGDKSHQNGDGFHYFGYYSQENGDHQHCGAPLVMVAKFGELGGKERCRYSLFQ